MEDGVGVPEELRCKRSDGKQWRCSAPSMPDKTVCEKHYIQAKKRAASSALRASLKKARRSSHSLGPDADANGYLASGHNGGPLVARSASSVKCKDRIARAPAMYSVEMPVVRSGLLRTGEDLRRDGLQPRVVYCALPGNAVKSSGTIVPGDYFGRSIVSAGATAGAMTCHQCQRSARVVWCISCDRRGYCGDCISRWYSDIPVDDIQKVCPACRGICNCRVCLRGDNLIMAKVQEISAVDKLRYLHSLLVYVLPVLKQIYADQCFEIGVETRVYGPKADIPRAKIDTDEQMCCDFCKVPIFDYHRHCTRCLYDLCLTCCRDIRRASTSSTRGEYTECQVLEGSKGTAYKKSRVESSAERTKSMSQPADVNNIDFASLFPAWKANSDGSIPCGPPGAGGCGSSKLVLRRIFKINWIAKLVKSSEEMVNGCRVRDLEKPNSCPSCNGTKKSGSTELHPFVLSQCSNREGISGNFLYSPILEDLKHEGICHFHRHWVKGEPVIIRHAFERSLSSSWDPLSIWRGIQEILEEKMDENVTVKAVDSLNQSEVDIELNQFIKGYSDGHKHEDGQPQMLKLKEWPPPIVLEEFLLCQRPEFIVNFPLVDFIHSKWGFLNLAAKLPPDALQPEIGPKLLIAYGSHEELGRGDSVTNLKIKMGDVVHMLMHTAEVHNQSRKRSKSEQREKVCEQANGKTHGNAYVPVHNLNVDMRTQSPDLTIREPYKKGYASTLRLKDGKLPEAKLCNGPEVASTEKFSGSSHPEGENTDASDRAQAGALWDVFCRQDVPKLNEYITIHWEELVGTARLAPLGKHPIYNQAVYLSKDHKRILKDEYGIEPWTFRQRVGEAVFIPAGCPFQVKNIQSTVQLALDFVSPESLGESARMAQEIRCLPNDHDAKLKMLEVGKMALYAASSAVREIQKISLDPKFDLDVRFEDRNLTAAVSENLARLTKQRKVACT